ncbi:MAG: porin family protein [Leptolyngbyaceae cyanobacterium RU_5_1]|nr:porin family protein [Leptolyngbyaceae cyanobacterium RU_5_1]
MQLSLKTSKAIAALSALATASVLLSAGAASAQPKGFDGAYVGGGISAGVTNGGQQEDAANIGGHIQGRVGIPKTPVSARGSVLFGSNNAAIMPMVTYDIPVARDTNVYVGAGYSFVEKDGRNTPLGNKSAPVVTVGAESGITKDIVVYGDAKLGVNAYQNSNASALSLQAGLGYRF